MWCYAGSLPNLSKFIVKPWYEPWNASEILAKIGLGIQLCQDLNRDLVIHEPK